MCVLIQSTCCVCVIVIVAPACRLPRSSAVTTDRWIVKIGSNDVGFDFYWPRSTSRLLPQFGQRFSALSSSFSFVTLHLALAARSLHVARYPGFPRLTGEMHLENVHSRGRGCGTSIRWCVSSKYFPSYLAFGSTGDIISLAKREANFPAIWK